MAIVLAEQLPFIRRELSDIPEDYASDSILMQSAESAWFHVQKLVEVADQDDDYLSHCIAMLGAYYVYLNYTSLAEIQLGTLPPTSLIKMAELKTKARTFIGLISEGTLDKDLNMDEANMKYAPTIIGITESVADGVD